MMTFENKIFNTKEIIFQIGRKSIKAMAYTGTVMLLAFVFTACEKKELLDGDEKTESEQEEILDFLAAENYNIDSVQFKGDYVQYYLGLWKKDHLLELINETNDYILPEDPDAADMIAEAGNRQRGITNGMRMDAIARNNVSNIRYFLRASIQNDLSTLWVDAIVDAADEWSDLSDCAINFTQVTDQAQADIIIGSDVDLFFPAGYRNLQLLAYGQSTYPNNGNAGNFITINNASIFAPFKSMLMMKLFATTLGYRFNNDNTAPLIHGTPLSESGSIMNATAIRTTPGLKTGDIRAARIYYPDGYRRPAGFSVSGGTGQVKITYHNTAELAHPYYYVRLAKYNLKGQLTQTRYVESTVDQNGRHTVLWDGLAPGTYQFALRGCNFRRDAWSLRTNQITVTID